MTNFNPQHKESIEKPKSESGFGIETVKRMANEVMGKDKNPEATANLANLDVFNVTEKDKEAITFMQSEILNIITKISKKYPDQSLSNIYPSNLAEIVKNSGIELRPSEQIAISKLELLSMNPESPASRSINSAWKAMIQKAGEARNGFTDKIIKRFKEKPGETLIYAAAGAAGIYIGYRLIKWLAGKGVDKLKNSAKEAAGEIFSTGNILAALGIGSLGLYLGKDAIKDYFIKKLGITTGVEEITKQINDISEKISKAQSSEEVEKLKKQAEELIAKAQAAKKEAKEMISQEEHDEKSWQNVREGGVPLDERKRAERISDFIKSQKANFEIKPTMIAAVGNKKYEELMKRGIGKLAMVAYWSQLAIDQHYTIEEKYKQTKRSILTESPEHLIEFLKELTINGGEIDDFKNKTIYEVLELIEKHPDKYLDPKKLKESQDKKIESDEWMAMGHQLEEDPSKAKDEKFMNNFVAKGAKAGLSIMLDSADKGSAWIYKNGVPVGKFIFRNVGGVMDVLAERLIKSDDNKLKAVGYYIKYGGAGYTAACGATLGFGVGIAKGVASGRGVIYGGWKIVQTTVSYGIKGFTYPLEVTKQLLSGLARIGWEWKMYDVSPAEAFRIYWKKKLSLIDEVKMSSLSRRIFKTGSFIEEVLSGEQALSGAGAKGIKNLDRFLLDIDIVRRDIEAQINELGAHVRKHGVQDQIDYLVREKNRILKIQEYMAEKLDEKHRYRKTFSVKRWESTIDKNLSAKIADSKIRDVLKIRGNERLGVLLLIDEELPFNEQHPLSKACFDNPKLIEHLNRKEDLVKSLMKNRDLINDTEVQKALAKGETEFFKAVEERAKIKVAEAAKTEQAATEVATKTEEATAKTTAKSAVDSAKADVDAVSNPKTPDEVVAKQAAQDTLEKAEALKKAEDTAKGGSAGSDAAEQLTRAEQELVESASKSSKAMEVVGKTSKLWQALKFTGKLGFGGLAGIGAGFSLYESGKGFYEAATTDIKGRSGIEATHATLQGVSGAADALFVASMLGAKGAAVSAGSAVAAPLAPIMYAGSKVYESYKEANLTEAEWGQKYSYDSLIHEWFSTAGYVSLGDAWVTGFGMKEVDESMKEKQESVHKIYRVLVALRSNPELMTVMYTEKPSREKDKKIESMIEGSYTKYHEYYFRQEGASGIRKYSDAQDFIAKACVFSDIMNIREQKKEKGEEFKVGSFDLTSDGFDFVGDTSNPVPKKNFFPSKIVEAYKNSFIDSVKKENPVLSKNLEKTETPYLLMLYVQMIKLLADSGKTKLQDEQINFVKEQMSFIRTYLESVRNINVNIACQNPSFFKADMKLKEIAENINGLTENNSLSYRLFEKANSEPRPEVRAMYRLAQFFGYTGFQKENDLKEFFSENNANYHGIYWNGKEWVIQKAGMDLDKKIGHELNPEAIHTIITELVNDSENIIEHRQDTVFANAYDYSDQVKTMASILEKGFNESVETYKTNTPLISIVSDSEHIKKAA